jgi:endo-1,4-beta-xylanase
MKNRLLRPSLAAAAVLALGVAAVSLTSCVTSHPGPKQVTLKDAFKKYFRVGVAINRSVATGVAIASDNANRNQDQVNQDRALVAAQFNQISPENDLKWEVIQPYEGSNGYNFAPADAYVNFGVSNHMFIVGHTLIWHSQTPGWVFSPTNGYPPPDFVPGLTFPSRPPGGRGGRGGRGGGGGPRATREQVLQRMHDHIATVVGRYKGKIKVWDVVNEALDDGGGTNILRPTSPWLQTVGPDFIAKAFEYAHEADPNAILRYNDYSLDTSAAKRHKLITLIKSLQAQHVPVMAIGSQTHVSVTSPTFQTEDQALTELATLGLPIHITELDVNGSRSGQRNTSADIATIGAATQGGLVDDANRKLADEYTALFNAFVKHSDYVKVITFWGVNDSVSWLGNSAPLLFDGKDQPKAAFDAVIATAHPPAKK